MKIRRFPSSGFTLIELLVVISIIAILAALAVPAISKGLDRAKVIQTVSNGKQIVLTATMMGNDASSSGDPKLGWPGELVTAGSVTSLSQYIDLIVDYDYMKAGDVGKVFSGPGVTSWPGDKGSFTTANSAFKVFKVNSTNSGDVIFLETKNYTYNTPLDPSKQPFGDTAFVVTRKDTSSTAYQKKQTGLYRQIGTPVQDPSSPAPSDSSAALSESPNMELK